MKEVLTTSFWRDVKKIFDDAREGNTPTAATPPAEIPEPPPAKPETAVPPVDDSGKA